MNKTNNKPSHGKGPWLLANRSKKIGAIHAAIGIIQCPFENKKSKIPGIKSQVFELESLFAIISLFQFYSFLIFEFIGLAICYY